MLESINLKIIWLLQYGVDCYLIDTVNLHSSDQVICLTKSTIYDSVLDEHSSSLLISRLANWLYCTTSEYNSNNTVKILKTIKSNLILIKGVHQSANVHT